MTRKTIYTLLLGLFLPPFMAQPIGDATPHAYKGQKKRKHKKIKIPKSKKKEALNLSWVEKIAIGGSGIFLLYAFYKTKNLEHHDVLSPTYELFSAMRPNAFASDANKNPKNAVEKETILNQNPSTPSKNQSKNGDIDPKSLTTNAQGALPFLRALENIEESEKLHEMKKNSAYDPHPESASYQEKIKKYQIYIQKMNQEYQKVKKNDDKKKGFFEKRIQESSKTNDIYEACVISIFFYHHMDEVSPFNLVKNPFDADTISDFNKMGDELNLAMAKKLKSLPWLKRKAIAAFIEREMKKYKKNFPYLLFLLGVPQPFEGAYAQKAYKKAIKTFLTQLIPNMLAYGKQEKKAWIQEMVTPIEVLLFEELQKELMHVCIASKANKISLPFYIDEYSKKGKVNFRVNNSKLLSYLRTGKA